MSVKKTPFHAHHMEAKARMVPFAGYSMPLLYRSIQEEHQAVRTNVGMFDLSHMGEFFCRGDGALAFLQRMTTNDVSALRDGQVQYTAMCYPDGGIVDDLLVYRLGGEFLLVVNAANIDKDWEWLEDHRPADVHMVNASDRLGMLAIQGPAAEQVLSRMTDHALADMGFYHCAVARFGGHELVFSRTGYTGEDGFEIYIPAEAADDVWKLATGAGGAHDMALVGLGARDSLRLEMRYALYGHELDARTNPIAAGLGWICKLDKGDFIGRDAIAAAKQSGPTEKLVCLELGPRAIPRDGYGVFADREKVGTVRSGLFSPSLARGIATAYVPSELSHAGTELCVEIRGRMEPAVIVKPPFYREGSHK